MNPVELAALFDLTDRQFRSRFRETALWRAHRRGLLRNAAVVLGNQQDTLSLPALSKGIHDAEPLVRGACAWALGELRHPEAKQALVERAPCEEDSSVKAEIVAALSRG